MAWFLLLFAIGLELLFARAVFQPWAQALQRASESLVVDLAALGWPKAAPLQWCVPVVIWVTLVGLATDIFGSWASWAGLLFGVLVLCVGLRFGTLLQVLLHLVLYLNQSDVKRAQGVLDRWAGRFGQQVPALGSAHEVVGYAIDHATERLVRQFFAPMFWYLLFPGALGVCLYWAVWWTVWRDPHQFYSQNPAQLWQTGGWSAVLNPRFVLHCMEFIPVRLAALCFASGLSWLKAWDAWQSAGKQQKVSDVEACVAVVRLGVGFDKPDFKPVKGLMAFRRRILRAALSWLAGLAVAVFLM